MGLLSDPSLPTQNKFVVSLAKHVRKLCYTIYLLGVVWFCCLALPEFNHGTYLSENALSPGLVYPEIRIDAQRLAVQLMEELQRERQDHRSTTPHAWIAAKFREFGLETHIHNYTLRYPFGGGKEFHGKNVYGILRAPRIGSTEGVVFSAPYRAPSSVHVDLAPSVPLLMAFADFARRKNYWAKDLIFLVTEQEQLGMQAWLDAYHEGDRSDDGLSANKYLWAGNLPARAGSLQAALNIEVQDLSDIEYVDVKIEGLNGKLPNLDMFNLVQRIMAKEGLTSGYKQAHKQQLLKKRRRQSSSNYEQNLQRMVTMLLSQCSGVPTGNHGLFHRYRIDALTITANKRQHSHQKSNSNSAAALLKAIEGIARSLNNLLERFHQSFFFYVIINNDRYISIGDYMPALMAMVASVFIKAYLTWSSLALAGKPTPYGSVMIYLTASLMIGYLGNVLPLQPYFLELPLSAAPLTACTVASLTIIGIVMPFVVILPPGGLELLHIALLLIYGCSLIVIGLLNFALGFFVGLVTVPLIIALNPIEQHKTNPLPLITFLLNPLIVIYGIILVMTFYQFPELSIQKILFRAASASMDASAFALIDSVIYGNWLYFAVCTAFLPLWIVTWSLALSKRRLIFKHIDDDTDDLDEMDGLLEEDAADQNKLKTN
ncbi:glycosylphosphatidylinositol anchor attachment 1 protein [Drosophila tropicalis]|uniref:glycosylphosphatidylinositol anchor attachment 1 protein n=1 Tax=Drosophila tropicalis TaxID=46794 RepID=UPI0035ABF8BC